MRLRSRLAAILAAALALATALPAAAQGPATPARPDPNDPDSVIVEELVVTARLPGPAWWTVSNGTSTVYVLGAPTLAPKRMDWDRGLFERRLAGANVVILPFQDVKVTFVGAFGAAFNFMRLRGGVFETTLDPATQGRFVAVRSRLGQPADHYATRNPLAAGLLLATDYRTRNSLTTTEPVKLVKLLAQRARVPLSQKSYDVAPLMGAVIRTPQPAGRACFDEVLAQAEAGPGVTQAAAKAWAGGDVRGALSNERTYERCIALVPGAAAFDTRVKTDLVAAIGQALKRPGHAIAVVPLRPLLAQGGVLDQLRAQGFTVTTPGEET
ncbi:TraB/GumN family protein [Phenylobacterium sp.]|uniref:TraB/GumN family protein n=1 Tax=Phenylobacterium sp. TaxID=1871053 RepID=UPI0025E14BC0|nr:TraB/GumN family protein [Phenylobacterium sp.]